MGTAAAPDDQPTRRHGDRGILGLVLLFVGVVWLIGRMGWAHLAARTLLSILLMCIGAGLLLTWRSGRRGWPILLGGLVWLCLIGISAAPGASAAYGSAVGGQSYQPKVPRDLPGAYRVGLGRLDLDLTRLRLPSSQVVKVVADVGVGSLTVMAPRGIGLDVQVIDHVGKAYLPGSAPSAGLNVDRTWKSPGYSKAGRHLDLDLQVGVGQLTVRQVGAG